MWRPDRETLDREALEAVVLDGMRATLARARTNAAWSLRLGDVRPADVKRVDDWQRLPFLTKDALRDARRFRSTHCMSRRSSRSDWPIRARGGPPR